MTGQDIDITIDPPSPSIVIGRYLLHRQIARGGMATIHIARLVGDEGFSRIVAAKRLHPELAEDADFVGMFLDEARIASKVHHRNVVPVLDVVTTGDEVVLVQEYVHGVPLHWLLRTAHEAKTHIPINVAVSIACQVLAGLQATHETVDEMGVPLRIVHRDVSPQNVMVAVDGTARLLDFGVAKAAIGAHVTREGTFKGKLAYSAPEQVRGAACQQSDIYALSVVLWELLVGHRMHGTAQGEAELIGEIMTGSLPTVMQALAGERGWLGHNRWRQLETLEPIIARGLALDCANRWETAADMEAALASAVPPASSTGIAAWLKALGKDFLAGRDKVIAAEEASWRKSLSTVSQRRPPTIVATTPEILAPRLAWPLLPGMRTIGTLLGLAVVAVLTLILYVVREPGREPPTAISQHAVVTKPVVIERPATVTPPPAPAALATLAAETPSPAPTTAEPPRPPPAPSMLPKASVAPRPPVILARPRVARVIRPAPLPQAAAPPPAPATVQEPTPDCTPPYYFEGAKKIFKSACL
jgi:serine/threonine-protein kinase